MSYLRFAKPVLRNATVALLTLSASAAFAATCPPDAPRWHTATATSFDDRPGLIAAWRTGSGANPAPVFNILPASVDSVMLSAEANGLVVDDFERYTVNGQTYFALAYTSGLEEQTLKKGYTTAGLQTLLTIFAQWKVVDLETFVEDRTRRWDILFREVNSAKEVELSMSGSALKTRAEGNGSFNYLTDFELLDPQSEYSSFAAVFEEGSGQLQKFFPNLSPEDFHDTLHDLRLLGYQLQDVEARLIDGEPRVAALFKQSELDDHLWAAKCTTTTCNSTEDVQDLAATFLNRFSRLDYEASYLRLIDLEIPVGPVQGPVILGLTGENSLSSARSNVFSRTGVIVAPICPPGGHAGVLHDSGTDIPTYP